jgi:hypothetical protein
LVEEGWCRRFSAAGERLSLWGESFEGIEHEACLLGVADDVPTADGVKVCGHCSVGDVGGLRVIFSRKCQ